jgi:branched-chain amino acid transport system ATP-binding protein
LATLLELDRVSKAFGQVVVADDLSYVLEAGEILGVVGPNGAGKTSMLNLITGNLAPDSGRILLESRDVTAMPVHARARAGMGRTHQIPRPFLAMTVFENVLIGASFAGRRPERDPRAAAVAALERTGLLAHANAPASSLTLLDRKRLELARALATDPRLLLLDEIAGGLAEHEVLAFIETIRALRGEGVGIIWIEHIVQALVSVVDRLIVTDYGRMITQGDPRAVLASAEVQSVYLGQDASA